MLPGKAPPGSRKGAEDGCESQSWEERVQWEIEQSLHPIIAQAFQRVNIILKDKDSEKEKDSKLNQDAWGFHLKCILCQSNLGERQVAMVTLLRLRQLSSATSWWKFPSVEFSICCTSLSGFYKEKEVRSYRQRPFTQALVPYLLSVFRFQDSDL